MFFEDKDLFERLTPKTQEYFKRLQEGTINPPSTEKADDFYALSEDPVPGIDSEDLKITMDNRDINYRRYLSADPTIQSSNSRDTLVFFHGGGFVFDSLECHHSLYTKIANEGFQVFAVSTRLSPKDRFPAGLNDAYDAAKYFYQHAEEYKVNPEMFVVGGSSSGGNFSAVVTQRSLNDPELNITAQLLVSPATDLTLSFHDYDKYAAQDYLLTQEILKQVYDDYAKGQDLRNPEISPAFAENFKCYPKTGLVVAEFDGQRNDAEVYAKKLQEEEVDVIKHVVKGHTHNSIVCRKLFSDGEDPVAAVINTLNQIKQDCAPKKGLTK